MMTALELTNAESDASPFSSTAVPAPVRALAANVLRLVAEVRNLAGVGCGATREELTAALLNAQRRHRYESQRADTAEAALAAETQRADAAEASAAGMRAALERLDALYREAQDFGELPPGADGRPHWLRAALATPGPRGVVLPETIARDARYFMNLHAESESSPHKIAEVRAEVAVIDRALAALDAGAGKAGRA